MTLRETNSERADSMHCSGTRFGRRPPAPPSVALSSMGGIISGSALPQLADLVAAHGTILPYLGGLFWGGGRGTWWLVLILVWHYMIFVVTNGVSTFNQDNGYFTNIQSQSWGEIAGFYIVIPVYAIGFFIVGAMHHYMLVLPYHLVPIGHLFETRRGKQLNDYTSEVKVQYALAMLLLTFLAVMGAWAPYEFTVMFLGGGNIGAPIAGSVCAVGAILLFVTPPVVMCGTHSNIWSPGPQRKNKSPTAGTLIVVILQLLFGGLLVSMPVALVAYFERDFDWTWCTAAIVWVVAVVWALVAQFACKERGESVALKTKDSKRASSPAGDTVPLVVPPPPATQETLLPTRKAMLARKAMGQLNKT
jgi:hypothetical protein